MTMKKKLDQAYALGEQTERGRILWLMDEMRNDLREQLEAKILIESTRHVVQTKIKMATALFVELQHMIMSNKQPPPKEADAIPEDVAKGLEMVDELNARVGNVCPKCGKVGYQYEKHCICTDTTSGEADATEEG